jgi:hypothetical protein
MGLSFSARETGEVRGPETRPWDGVAVALEAPALAVLLHLHRRHRLRGRCDGPQEGPKMSGNTEPKV